MILHKSLENCWAVFLACILETPISETIVCSTEDDDWIENTQYALRRRGLFFIEVDPAQITLLPEGAIVGAGVTSGSDRRHIVIAKVENNGTHHSFSVVHDPVGKLKPNRQISPCSIVLICKMI